MLQMSAGLPSDTAMLIQDEGFHECATYKAYENGNHIEKTYGSCRAARNFSYLGKRDHLLCLKDC